MRCSCGCELSDDMNFCTRCGKKVARSAKARQHNSPAVLTAVESDGDNAEFLEDGDQDFNETVLPAKDCAVRNSSRFGQLESLPAGFGMDDNLPEVGESRHQVRDLVDEEPEVWCDLAQLGGASVIEDPAEAQEVYDILNAHFSAIPHHDCSGMFNAGSASEISRRDSFCVAISLHNEMRTVYEKKGPLYQPAKTFPEQHRVTIQNVKPWSYVFPVPAAFEKDDHLVEIPESIIVETCVDCHGKGAQVCSSCHGQGKSICYSCNGQGRSVCYSCHGSGSGICHSCHGSGSISYTGVSGRSERMVCGSCNGSGRSYCFSCGGTGSQVCYSCGGSGARLCTSCGGSGNIECETCAGTGKTKEWVDLYVMFNVIKLVYNTLPDEGLYSESLKIMLRDSKEVLPGFDLRYSRTTDALNKQEFEMLPVTTVKEDIYTIIDRTIPFFEENNMRIHSRRIEIFSAGVYSICYAHDGVEYRANIFDGKVFSDNDPVQAIAAGYRESAERALAGDRLFDAFRFSRMASEMFEAESDYTPFYTKVRSLMKKLRSRGALGGSLAGLLAGGGLFFLCGFNAAEVCFGFAAMVAAGASCVAGWRMIAPLRWFNQKFLVWLVPGIISGEVCVAAGMICAWLV